MCFAQLLQRLEKPSANVAFRQGVGKSNTPETKKKFSICQVCDGEVHDEGSGPCLFGPIERAIVIQVTDQISLSETELKWHFVRASGPGGQNVNKVSSAVELRFDIAATTHVPVEVKTRLRRLAGSRITGDGILVIQARRFRSQARNRDDALQRLIDLVSAASISPKLRKPTAPSRAAKRRRLEAKKTRAATKQSRGAVKEFD